MGRGTTSIRGYSKVVGTTEADDSVLEACHKANDYDDPLIESIGPNCLDELKVIFRRTHFLLPIFPCLVLRFHFDLNNQLILNRNRAPNPSPCLIFYSLPLQSSYYYLSAMRGLPQTTQQMMQNSIGFKISFGSAIALCIITIVMACLLPYVNCSSSQPCPYYYSYYTDDCYRGNTPYCCNRRYSYCGDSSYCVPKPSYFRTCWGIALVMEICGGMTIFLAVVVFIMFCNFKRRASDPVFNPYLIRNQAQIIPSQHLHYPPPYIGSRPHNYINQPALRQEPTIQRDVSVPLLQNKAEVRDRRDEPSLLTDAEYHNV